MYLVSNTVSELNVCCVYETMSNFYKKVVPVKY